MQHYEHIRRMILVDGLSIREVSRRLRHTRKSIRKAIENSAPPKMQIEPGRPRPKFDPFMPMIRQWLTDDLKQPRKQRHTAVRLWERIKDEYQFTGGRRSVSDAVKMIRRELVSPEILVPIEHPCGEEFQVDCFVQSCRRHTRRSSDRSDDQNMPFVKSSINLKWLFLDIRRFGFLTVSKRNKYVESQCEVEF